MPKIIDALREKLLAEARRMLLEGGELTIRGVASRCHVAVGTVYNYFRSKDELMAFVMLADWQLALAAMQQGAMEAPTALEGLRCVWQRLAKFEALYRPAWNNYAKGNDAHSNITQRHGLLLEQLSAIVTPLLAKHNALWTDYLPTFLCETLLTAASRGENGFEEIAPILERLIIP